ncbi:MAG TPA: hypothetical protein VL614_15010 [Acetobacteraceae bacterium]|jgi:hypothetical protein|nr:hypothetical protein [Acetobacteraceae bacterium]
MQKVSNQIPTPTSTGPKISAAYSFEHGSLTVRRSGYGAENGDGWFCFDADNLDWEPYEERSGQAAIVKVGRADLIELRNWLNQEFPPEVLP